MTPLRAHADGGGGGPAAGRLPGPLRDVNATTGPHIPGRRARRRPVGRTVGALVALAAVLATTLTVATPSAARAAIAPQADLNGSWYDWQHYDEEHRGRLGGSDFVAHYKDCNGDRVVVRGIPTNPELSPAHVGRRFVAYTDKGETRDGQCKRVRKRVFVTFRDEAPEWTMDVEEEGALFYSKYYKRKGSGTPKEPECNRTGFSATRRFVDTQVIGGVMPVIFSVQFSNIKVCFTTSTVRLVETPLFRVWTEEKFAQHLQGICNGASHSVINNPVPQADVFIECRATFSNKVFAGYTPRAVRDTDGTSQFTIAPRLNAAVTLPPFTATTPEPAEVSRSFVLRIYPNGCYFISGVGEGTQKYCF